jgi:N-acetylneuraminate synthase/N,N'-diacetyllegionaminate synthase
MIMNQKLKINDILIGLKQPVFVVAEIGINHNGDIGLAKESIYAAAEAGANSVKFQNYRTEDFIADRSLMLDYTSQGKNVREPQYDLFKRCELSRNQLALLKETCDSCGIVFHGTPTSKEGIDDLVSLGAAVLKNGSDYLTNLDLVRAMGETGLTTVLSTGMATLTEIDQAVQVFRETGNPNLLLLHCTSSYPTPPEETNLSRLNTLKTVFGVPVGFSDHTTGTTAAIGSVIMGACWIEKHFTLDRSLPGPDHWFSMNPTELRELVMAVRDVEKMIGTAEILPTVSEEKGRQNFRLSCTAARDIQVGEYLVAEDIIFQRPGDGIPPTHVSFLIGMQAKQPILKGNKIKKEHFYE